MLRLVPNQKNCSLPPCIDLLFRLPPALAETNHPMNKSSALLSCLRRHFTRPLAFSLTFFLSLWSVQVRGATLLWNAASSTDFDWETTSNWSSGALPTGADDLTFPFTIPNPGALPKPETITLGAGELANSLIFKNNYTLTGGDLTLVSGLIRSDTGFSATINSILHGTAGFSKSGAGSLVLTGINDFTGATVVEQGAVVINNSLALGSDSSMIIINGFSSRAVAGGQLVVAPTITAGAISGMTFNRSIALSGRGPAADGVALLSIGNNTFTGNIFMSNLGESRIGSAYGTVTFSGNVDGTVSNNLLVLVGNGNFKFAGSFGAGNNINATGLNKSGSGGLDLTGLVDNNFLGRFQIDAGSVRVSNGSQLGRSTRADAILPNGGFLEIRSDAGNTFSGLILQGNSNSTALIVDRALAGTGSLNQTVVFAGYNNANNVTPVTTGRNGTNLLLPTATLLGAANGSAWTWSGNGLATLGSFSTTSTTATQTLSITNTGDVLITGAFNPTTTTTGTVFRQNGTGMLTVLGANGGSSGFSWLIANGTMSVASSAASTTTGIQIGTGTTTGALNYLGAGGGALYGGTGAGETWSKPIVLNSSANNIIFANQTGSAPTALNFTGTLTQTAVTTNSLYLAGASALANTFTTAIANGTGAFNVGKSGTGTWVLGGNNTYTGNTGIYGGTLRLTNAAMTSLTGGLIFNSDATGAAVSATAATGGWTGYQTAGGTLEYSASGGNLTFTGAITPAGGAGNVSIIAGTSLTFGSLGTRAAGATLNFTPGSGAIKFTAAVAGTNGIVGGFATINGTDFVTSVTALGSVGAPTYTAAGATFDSTVSSGAGAATKNFLSNATQSTAGVFAANSLKVSAGSTLTLAGNLTITSASATSLGGILFDNSGGTGGITGSGITINTASQELIFYTGGSTPTNAFTVASNILNNTATIVTKSGSGTMVLSGTANAFTGNLNINEGTLRASGTVTNLLGVPAAASITSIRQTATLDINGAGTSIIPYGTATALPTVNIGALQGGGNNIVTLMATTTSNGAFSNTTTVDVASITGLALGQTVTGSGIGGYPVIVGISGNSVTLSSPVTIVDGTALAFSKNETVGAKITNGGSASAISLGISTSTGTTVYTGLIQNGAGATTVIVNGTSARFQTLTGYNTYTGATIISGGSTLRVTNLASGGVASAIGASSNAAGNLVFNNGILQYIGGTVTSGNVYQNTQTPSVSIDRLFTIAGNATIDSSGTFGNNFLTGSTANNAALVFSNTGAVSYANTSAAPRTLTLQGSSIGDNQINLQLVDNGANALSLTKTGASLWILGGANNTYTGTTTITTGNLRAQDTVVKATATTATTTASAVVAVASIAGLTVGQTVYGAGITGSPTIQSIDGPNQITLSSSQTIASGVSLGFGDTGGNLPGGSNLNFNGGVAVLESSGTFVRGLGTGAGAVRWTAGQSGGFAASTAKLTVNIGGAGATLAWNSTANFLTTGTLQLGSTTSLFETEFANGLDLNGGTRTITVTDNASTALDYTTLTGVISNSSGTAGNLVVNPGASTYLLGANTYDGTTNIVGTTNSVYVTSLGNSVTGSGAATSVGTASAATTAAIIFGNTTTTGGFLTYVGAGETSDRALTSLSTTGGITIDASGSGALVLTGTFTNNNTAAAAKVLSLNGLNTDFNTISSDLFNNTGAGGGALGVTKGAGGTWVLSGNNTYTGTTSLSGGVLGVGSANALGTAGTAGAISWDNAGLMAVGADRTIVNSGTTINNNVNANVMGQYSLTFSNLVTVNTGANNSQLINNIVQGKSLTLDGGLLLNNSTTTSRTFTIEGAGNSIVNGAITQNSGANGINNVLAYTGRYGTESMGTLTFGGSGSNTLSSAFVQNSGLVQINRTDAFSSNTYTFTGGYLQNISGAAITLIPALLTTGVNAGQAGALTLNSTQLYLLGSGANASIEIAGQLNDGAGSRTIYNQMTGAAVLTLSGTVNLSGDTTARTMTINGTGTGTINLTGLVLPSTAGPALVGGTLIKGALGDLNIAPTSSLNAPTNGNLVVTGGTVTFNQTNTQSFSLQKIDVAGNAALNIDYQTNNVTTSVGSNSGAFRTINLLGGTLNFTANSTTGTNETLGALQMGFASLNLPFGPTGIGTINFINGGSSNSSLSFAQLNPLQSGGALNIVATDLGTTNKVFLPGLLINTAFGTAARITINGTDYATTSSTAGVGLVAFTNYVTSNNLDKTQTLAILPQIDNFNLTATPTFTGQTVTGLTKTVNNIKISGNNVNVGSGTSMFQLTLGGGGVLATGTGGVISVPVLSLGAEGFINVAAGADLTISSAIAGASLLLNKTGDGVLTLTGTEYYSSSTVVSGGTLKMGAGNILPNFQTATTPTLQNLHVNYGATFDLNGTSQFAAALNNNNGLQNSGGTITNTAVGQANLYTNTSSTFGGVITNSGGALNLYKHGGTTANFSSNNTYTGTTNIYGANFLGLIDGGRLSNTSAVNIYYGAGIQFNNTGNQDLSNRINTSAAFTLYGGTIRLDGAMTKISQQSIGDVTLAGGLNSMAANINGSGGAFLTAASLTRNTGATLNFTGNTLGILYNNTQSGRIIFTSAPTLTNNLIGGWATLGGTEFATYISAVDASISPSVAQGVTTLQSYVTTADTTWTSADNVKMVNNSASVPAVYTLGGNRTINSLNIQSTTNGITVNNPGTLTIGSGGLLSNGVANILAGGVLTAGLTSGAAELFILSNIATTITSQITDNTAGGSVSLVSGLAGVVTTLSPTVDNTYSGLTTVNAGTLTFGSAAGITVITGNLVVNNAAVTFTQLQQIASGKNLTINGAGGAVTFAGSGNNVLGAVSFVNNGGATTPQITGGTVVVSSLSSQNDSLTTTPTVASILDLNGSNLTVTTSGVSLMDLIISGVIQSGGSNGASGGQLTKAGLGSLVLSGVNTFSGGIALNAGTLIVNADSTPTSGTVTAGPLGTGTLIMAGGTTLMGGTAVRTLANAITVNGNILFGGPAAANNITLSGAVAFGSSARTITVASPVATAILSGTLSGTQGLTKDGLGTLSLTGGTVNYTPGINVNAGILSLDQTVGSFSAPIVVADGATVNFNVGTAGNIGASVNPAGTPLAISGAGQVTKTGTQVVNVYGNLTYTGPTTIQTGSLLLSPNAITNAAPTFTASSMINLGTALVSFGLDNIGATGAISVGGGVTAINFMGRDTVISNTRNGDFASTLNLGGVITRSAGATGIFNFVNNVTFQPSANDSIITSNQILVGGSAGVIDQGVYITSGNIGNPVVRTDYAYRDATGFVRQTAYGVDPGTYYSAGVAPVTATSGSFKIVGSVAPNVNFVAGSGINTFQLGSPNSDLTLKAGSNVISGILRTAAGASASGLLVNAMPYFATFMTNVQGGDIDNDGKELVVRVDNSVDWLTISSKITGAGDLTKVGSGSLIIGGTDANTFTGTTYLLGSATVYLNKTGGVAALPGNVIIGDAGNALTVQLGLLNNYSISASTSSNTGVASNNQIATSAIVTFNSASALSLNGSNQELAGIQTLSGNAIVQNGLVSGDASSTLTINNATDFNLGAGSTIRDAAAAQYANLKLVKQGAGKLTVGILANTGGVDVQSGVLAIGAASSPGLVAVGTAATALGTGFLKVASGAALDLNGFDLTVDYLSGAGVITNTGTATKTLTIGNLNNTNMATGANMDSSASWSGVIADGTSAGLVLVQKRGAGTQTITTAQDFSGGIAVLGGTLVLDMSGLTNPNNIVRSANGLNMAGNLTIKGAATGTSSQQFAGTLTNAGTTIFGGASEILGNANGGTSLTIDLGGLTRGANNATINFTSATNVIYKTTGLTAVSGYATWNGVDWAVSSGGVLGAFSAYTNGLPTATGSSSGNYQDTSAGVTLTAAVALNSLKLAPTATQTISLGAINNALNFTTVATTGPAGLLFDGTSAAATISGGGATGITGSVASTDLVITTNHTGVGPGNSLTINSVIGGSLTTVTKAGTDTVVLGGTNTFTGILRVNEGTVSFASVAATGTAQPLGKGNVILGGNAKTATLNYTGATATTWTQTITLGDGGIGQFSLTAGSISTLTVGGVISGGGGLTVLTPTTSGSGLILSGTNTYLGQTIIQSGAKVSVANSAGLGAAGTIANGTIIQSGGQLDIQDNKPITEIVTVNGTGIGGVGAITYSGATTDLAASLKSVILGSNSLITANGTTVKQLGFSNGFIQGNGYTLTLNSTNFTWFVNETIDNLPTITTNGSVVVQQMTLGGGSGQTITFTGASKNLQFRTGVVDRQVIFTGVAGSITSSTAGGDNFVLQDVTMNNAASTTLTLSGSGNGTVTILGNILKGGAGSVPVTRGGGFVVLGGISNTFQGGIAATAAGTLKLMPVSPGTGALTNPFSSTNTVGFTAAAGLGSAYPLYNMSLILDNTKTGGDLSQAFAALSTGAGLSPTIQLNNATGNSLSLTFASYARTAGSNLLLGITGAYTTPGTTNKIDIVGGLTAASQAGTFWNGTSFVIRDTNNFLRPINYSTDTGANLVSNSTSVFTNTGGGTNHSNIASGGSITAQGTATIGTLAFGAGATDLTLDTGATLTLATAGILKTGGGTSTITGGTALQLGVASTTDSVIRVDSVSDTLVINSAISFFNTTTQTLSKFGQGRLTLGGTSSITGVLNVNQGTVRLTSSAAFGTLATNTITTAIKGGAIELYSDPSGSGITIANNLVLGVSSNDSMGWMGQNTGTLRNISGNNTVTGSVTSTGYNRINSDSGTLTINNLTSGTAEALGGVTSTPGGVAGNILILAQTGAQDINHDGTGKLTLRPTVSMGLAAKTLALQGGTTVFDFTSMTTATNVVAATAILNMQGSIFQLLGKTSGASAQTFATFTQKEGLNRIQGNANTGTGLTLTLGAYASPAVTAAAGTAPFLGTIDFLPSTNVTYSATAGGAAVNTNGIMGPSAIYNGFATAGDDWAVVNGTTILNYATNGGLYTDLPASGSTAATNYKLTGTQTVTTTQSLNSLKLDASSTAVSLTVNSGTQLNTNAFLLVGSKDVTLAGAGTVGSLTSNNYFHIQGSGNLLLNTTITDNSGAASVGLVFAGTGTGGITIGSTGAINFASNTNTDSIYFEGGVPGTSRIIVNNGAINFNSKGSIDIGRTGTDSVDFTNNGVISLTAGTFNVGSTASAYGSYTQSSSTSSFTATGANVQFAASTLASVTASGGLSAGSATFSLSGGTFAVGGTSGSGNSTIFGGFGNFVGTQSGGTITLNRPGNIALYIAQDGGYGASSTYSMSGGSLSVNGSTIIGARNGANGSFTIADGATANFYQGLTLGLQDYAQGKFTQNGGTVNIGTGSNISDTSYLKGDNTIDLMLGYNQTTNAGTPATTQGTYNLNGGVLRVNGIATGQGNGYTSSSNAAASTFTDSSNALTTTTGGTANFNWGGGTLSPFDAALTIGLGVNVTLTAAGATLNTDDAAGISRLVTFNTPITGNFGLTETGGGLLLLTSVNTYSGDTNIVSGILRPGVANAIPNGPGKGNVILNSGVSSAGTLGLNGLSITINGLVGDSANAVLGQVVNNVNGVNATFTVGDNNQTSVFNGLIKNNNNNGLDNSGTGTIALVKIGSGSLTLGGANSYTGATSVTNGALYVNGALSTASAVTVASGKIFGGNGSAGAVTIGAGGTLNPGLSGTGAGDLTLTGLNFGSTGTINFRNVQDGASAAVIDAGALVLGGGTASISLNIGAGSGAWGNGAYYKLIGYTSFSGSLSDFTLINPSLIPGLSSRQTAALFNDTGLKQIQLNIIGDSPRWSGYDTTAAAVSTAWKPADASLTNWTLITGGGPTNFISGDQVLFDDVIDAATQASSPTAVIVDISDGDVDPSAVTFNNTAGGTFAATGVYTLQGINGITGSTSLVKSGNGWLVINNANSFTGGINLNGGIIIVGNAAALGATSNTLAFGASSGAKVKLNNNSVILGGLTGDSTSTVENGGSTTDSTLTISGSTTSIFAGTLQDGSGANKLGLTTGGTATLVLTGTNTFTGATVIGAGSTLQIGNNGTSGKLGEGNVAVAGSLIFNRSDSVAFADTVTGIGSVTIQNGTLVLTGALNNTGTNLVNSGATLQVGDGTTNGTLGNITANGTLAFNNNGTAQTYSGNVLGTGALNILGGTLVLTGSFANTGADTISSGATLQIGDGGAINGVFASDVTDNGTLAFKLNSTSLTYANAASGTGGLRVISGTLILSSGNSYTGGTIIDSGATLQLGTNGTTGSITGDVTNNGTFVINRGPLVTSSASFGGNITGTGAFNLTGKAIVVLSSTGNTFSGGTNVQQGTLRAGATNVLSANSIVTVGSPGLLGTLQLFGFNQTVKGIATSGTAVSQVITNGAGTNDAVLTLNSGLVSTFGGAITNGSTKKTGITLLGGHTLILTNLATANTYTGITAVQAGTLQIGAINAGAGASVITLGGSGTIGTLDLNGFNGTVGGLATDSLATQTSQVVGNSVSSANTLTLTPVAASTNIFGGVIQDNFGSGSGTTALTLNGANATTSIQVFTGSNTYTGTTALTQGVLQIGNAGTTGTLGAGAVTIASTATLLYNRTNTYTLSSGNGITGSGAISLTGGGTLDTGTTNDLVNTTGALNFGSANASTILGNFSVKGNATVGSMVVQTNSASANTLTIATGKTLTVTGSTTIGSTTTGSTTAFTTSGGSLTINGGLNAGVVATGSTTTNATFTNTNLTVAGSVNIGSTSSATGVTSNVTVTGGSATFNLGANAMNIGLKSGTTSTGVITSAATLDLSGASSVSITGSAGSSIVIGSNTDATSGTAADQSRGTLKLSTAGANTVAASTITLGNSTTSGTSGTQGFIALGNAANDFQVDTLYVGRQKSQPGGTPSIASNLMSFAGTGGTLTLGGLSGTKTNLNIGYNDPGTTGTSSVGVMDLTGGTFNATLGTVTIGYINGTNATGGGIGTLTMAAGIVTADQIRLAEVTGGVVGTTAGTLNLNGGTFTLASGGSGINGGSAVTGVATVNLAGGTLDMNGTNIGAAAPNAVTLNAQSGTLSNLGQLNNGATLNKTTAGTLILDGVNAYTGLTTVTAGIVSVRSDTGLGNTASGTVVSSGASLELQNNIAVGSEALSISGTGSANNGALRNLSGNNTYGGQVTLNAAATIQSDAGTLTLDVSSGSAIAGAAQNVTFTGAGNIAVADPIATTTGSLTKNGVGTLTLSGVNSYTGATTVNAGTLQVGVNGVGSIANSAVVINSTATLSGSGSIAGSTIIGNGAVLAPGEGPPGLSEKTLTFTSAGTALEIQSGGKLNLSLASSSKIDSNFDWVATDALTYLNGLTANGTSFTNTNYVDNWKTAESTYDSIKLTTGSFKVGTGPGTITLTDNGGTYALGNIFKLLDWSSVGTTSIAGGSGFTAATDLDLSGIVLGSGLGWDYSAFANYGIVVVVPEPSRAMLLLFGLLGLFFRRRKRSL